MMKKKNCMIVILIISLVLVMCSFSYKHISDKKEKEELLHTGYTEYNLTGGDLFALAKYLDICPPEYRSWDFFDTYKYNWEKKDLKLETGNKTEEQLKKVNELIFFDTSGENLREVAEQYGFNEFNLITLEWVMAHPKEMADIFRADESQMRFIGLNMDDIYNN